MKAEEFKAWFDGYTEALGNRMPTKAQWTRIKERIAEIDGTSVTRHYYHEHWPYVYLNGTSLPNRWVTYSTSNTASTSLGNNISQAASGIAFANNLATCTGSIMKQESFDSAQAMYDLGVLEASQSTD